MLLDGRKTRVALLFAISLVAWSACGSLGQLPGPLGGKSGLSSTTFLISWSTGAFWTAAYVLAIRRGFLDRTYGIPLVAVCANVAWEALNATVLRGSSPVGPVVPMVWLVLDAVILYQCFSYRSREVPFLGARLHAVLVFGGIAFFGAVILLSKRLNLYFLHSAFAQLLLMAVLFLAMQGVRKDARGQSVYIGLCILAGNAVPVASVLSGRRASLSMESAAMVLTLATNAVYVVLLWLRLRRLGIGPLTRL